MHLPQSRNGLWDGLKREALSVLSTEPPLTHYRMTEQELFQEMQTADQLQFTSKPEKERNEQQRAAQHSGNVVEFPGFSLAASGGFK